MDRQIYKEIYRKLNRYVKNKEVNIYTLDFYINPYINIDKCLAVLFAFTYALYIIR